MRRGAESKSVTLTCSSRQVSDCATIVSSSAHRLQFLLAPATTKRSKADLESLAALQASKPQASPAPTVSLHKRENLPEPQDHSRALHGLRGGRSCPHWQESVHGYHDGCMGVFNIRTTFGCFVESTSSSATELDEEPSETHGAKSRNTAYLAYGVL